MPPKVTRDSVNNLVQAIKDAPTDDVRITAEMELADLVLGLDHTVMGPTWKTNPDGSWLLPEKTLGWTQAGWCARYLHGPESTDESPTRWNFTDEQLRLLLWWYAVDENGRFVYRTGVLQRLKGWGKDPLLAVICILEFVGP